MVLKGYGNSAKHSLQPRWVDEHLRKLKTISGSNLLIQDDKSKATLRYRLTQTTKIKIAWTLIRVFLINWPFGVHAYLHTAICTGSRCASIFQISHEPYKAQALFYLFFFFFFFFSSHLFLKMPGRWKHPGLALSLSLELPKTFGSSPLPGEAAFRIIVLRTTLTIHTWH